MSNKPGNFNPEIHVTDYRKEFEAKRVTRASKVLLAKPVKQANKVLLANRASLLISTLKPATGSFTNGTRLPAYTRLLTLAYMQALPRFTW